MIKDRYFEKKPWMVSFYAARSRCTKPESIGYYRYGGRGIKMLLSQSEIKMLWERDGAADMAAPSIDRINVDGNYEVSNCRFIERSENSRRAVAEKSECHKRHPGIAPKYYFYPNKPGRVCKLCINASERADRIKRGCIPRRAPLGKPGEKMHSLSPSGREATGLFQTRCGIWVPIYETNSHSNRRITCESCRPRKPAKESK